MEANEVDLIQRFQAGEIKAFDDLMILFQDRALSLAWHLVGNRDDALDIVQEAFIRLYRMLPRWEPRASLFTWIYRVILNLARDRGRKKSRAGFVSMEKLPELVDRSKGNDPGSVLVAGETGLRIKKAVNDLPRKQKEVFVLRHYEGRTLKEIALIQKRSVGTVKANLFLAVHKLRETLSDLVEEGESN